MPYGRLVSKLSDLVRRRKVRIAPLLSVVVPVYNVEQYLAECLESLLGQSFTDFEAVLVDDGSTDGSAAVAQEYVDRDPRLRLVRQANAGLGAARNAGVREARGAYLAFLDSDDTLPPEAYALMMSTIERTGSDMVVGTLKRDDGRSRVAMRLMRQNHRSRREQVTLAEMPLMLADVFAVNKIYRRSFWEEAGLDFPVDVRYEDQPTLTRAFLASKRFDVLPETVYLWRVRHDGSSITQRRDDLADLVDRIATKRMSTDAVLAAAQEVRDTWFREVLPVDMWEYFRAAVDADEEYWALLRSAMTEFWNDDTVPFDRTAVPVQQRAMGWLVTQGLRAELRRLIAYIDEREGDIPVEVHGGEAVAVLPDVELPGAPRTIRVLGAHEIVWESRVTEASWQQGRLTLRGFALMRNVPTLGRRTVLTGTLARLSAEGAGPHVVELPVEQVEQPRATRFAGRPSQNFDACGFVTTIDVPELVATDSRAGVWRILLERRVDGISASGGVTSFDRPDVDTSWHGLDGLPQGWDARARLRVHDGELVLEVREDSLSPGEPAAATRRGGRV